MNKKTGVYIYLFAIVSIMSCMFYMAYKDKTADAALLQYTYPSCLICKESVAGEYIVLFLPLDYEKSIESPPIEYAHLKCALASLEGIPLKRKIGEVKETRKICAAPGCDSTAIHRGFCGNHRPPLSPKELEGLKKYYEGIK